jgi:hypothetical protein
MRFTTNTCRCIALALSHAGMAQKQGANEQQHVADEDSDEGTPQGSPCKKHRSAGGISASLQHILCMRTVLEHAGGCQY